MKQSHLLGALGACAITFCSMSAHAALIGVLPATLGGTDYQAYYDDQLDISWTANANINGINNWDNQVAWAASLDIDGVTGWHLPSMDVNGDGVIVNCSSTLTSQAACKDNEYGHLFNYGAGIVFGSGITTSSPGPFSNIQFDKYWSGTESGPASAWRLGFNGGQQLASLKGLNGFAWAVRTGNVSTVPVPAAVWLFGSGLIGLIGVARRKKA